MINDVEYLPNEILSIINKIKPIPQLALCNKFLFNEFINTYKYCIDCKNFIYKYENYKKFYCNHKLNNYVLCNVCFYNYDTYKCVECSKVKCSNCIYKIENSDEDNYTICKECFDSDTDFYRCTICIKDIRDKNITNINTCNTCKNRVCENCSIYKNKYDEYICYNCIECDICDNKDNLKLYYLLDNEIIILCENCILNEGKKIK